MPDSLARVRRATRKRDAALARADALTPEWREAIRDAHAEGHSLRAIAKEAGITNPRVHQIVHG